MIPIKTASELKRMRVACRLTAELREAVAARIHAGVTTAELDAFAADWIKERGYKSAFFGYNGYPAQICISINDVIVHGIPGREIIQDGDIVSIDLGVAADGFIGDSALTVLVGDVKDEARQLCEATKAALAAGIAAARHGARLGDVSAAIQRVGDAAKCGIVRDYCGHGIGRRMHEDPQIFNFGTAGKGPLLQSGMTLAIEPMFNAGTWKTKVMEDGWTVRTLDGKPSAHYEHTILVTPDGGEILTTP